MQHRLLALLLVLACLVPGCAGLFSTGYCDLHCEDRQSYNDDKDTSMVLPIAIGAAALIAVIIYASHDRGDEAPDDAPAAAPVTTFARPPEENTAELRLARMFMQGQMSARAGRCEATLAIGRQLARTSPADHALYVADPVIATCF